MRSMPPCQPAERLPSGAVPFACALRVARCEPPPPPPPPRGISRSFTTVAIAPSTAVLVAHDGSNNVLILEVCRAVCARRPSPPIFSALFIIPSAFHFHGSVSRPWRRIDSRVWRGVPSDTPRRLRASAASRRLGAPPTRLARRPARCSRPASATAAGAGSGVGRLLEPDFDSHRCQVGGGERGGRSTEQFGDRGVRGGNGGASGGDDSGAAATASRGAMRPHAAIDRAAAGCEAAVPAAELAGACAAAVQVQRGRVRAYLLM